MSTASPDTREIPLTRGLVAIVDADDYEWLNQWKWCDGHGYAVRTDENRKHVRMHRAILNASEGVQVDHINGNRRDNRRSNLRLCSHAENGRNRRKQRPQSRSIFKGVSFHKATSKWRSYLRVEWHLLHLGLFASEIEAAKAYDVAALAYHGDFAKLNFPNEVTHE